MDRTSRRRLLVAAAALPVAFAAIRLGDALGIAAEVRRAAADAIRPSGTGSTATRCAACGSTGHAMLDARCPAAPRVRPGTAA